MTHTPSLNVGLIGAGFMGKAQEIAALLDIAEGTSKAQLHRARRLLREMLDR